MNIPYFQKRTILWTAGTVFVVLLVSGWILSGAGHGNLERVDSSAVDDNAEISTGQVDHRHQRAQVSTTEESSSREQVDIFDLLDACPKFFGELSEECMKALDFYFPEKPLVHPALDWVEFPDALTYDTIFSNPAGDRERVFAALENPECRFEDGKIRVDLKETCDAEAFARFSKFLEICEFGGDPGDFREIQFKFLEEHFHQLRHEANEPKFVSQEDDTAMNLTRTERLRREWHLEMEWRTERCTEPMDQVLAVRNVLQTEMLKEIGLRFNIDPNSDTVMGTMQSTRYIGSFRVLRSIAHRLGADETVSSTYRPSLDTRDLHWDNHISETRPWLDSWERMLGKPSRLGGVQVAIDLALSLDDLGAEFDWNYLVERVCHKFSSDQTSCQTAIAEIRMSTDWSEKRRHQALDEFETRALELGLYD